jgi:POT family proton-dependent oligopeptide transporter
MAWTETWERFSFYGLQGILAFYLLFRLDQGGLEMDPAVASAVVGAYGGSVYVAQIIGAWLGDRLVPPRWMVFYGGLIIMAGHIVLAVIQDVSGLILGLSLIVTGTGALKINITSIVGLILDRQDPNVRDIGFSYFYLAINIGAVAGPLGTGFAQSSWGFHWGFALAAFGMAGALVQYVPAMGRLPEPALRVNHPLPSRGWIKPAFLGVAIVAAVTLAVRIGWITKVNLAIVTTFVALALALGTFAFMLASGAVSRVEKRRVLGYLPLFLTSGTYYGLLFQQFTAVSILIIQRVDLTIGSWTFPAAWIATASPLAAVVVTPAVAAWWRRQGSRQASSVSKFSWGVTQMGLSYGFILIVSTVTGDGMIPLALILLFMALSGSSEVWVGPIGLAVATKVAPKAHRAQMVGLSFFTLALGSSLSGLLGQYFTVVPNTVYFITVTAIGLGLGGILYLSRRMIDRLVLSGMG